MDLKEAEMWAKTGDLHRGESEAFVLAKRKDATYLLTDVSAARMFTSLLGLEVHGSLGVILWNNAKGYLFGKETELALNALQSSSLWLSEKYLLKPERRLLKMKKINFTKMASRVTILKCGLKMNLY